MEQTPGSPTGSSSTTGSSDPSSASGTAQDVKNKAQQAAREAKSKAQQAAQKVKEQGKQQLESGKEGAVNKAEQLADAVNRASDELHQQQEYGLADYASQVAAGINRFADTLRHRSIDDLIAETESLARRSPTVFFLGSVGVGLALSRFLKASTPHGDVDVEPVEEEIDVSYGTSSEWQQPEASQSIYGGPPSDTARAAPASSWSTETRGNDFDVHQGSEGGNLGASEPAGGTTNNPPGGTYR